ncbi:unnamed protein product [Paramecium pentaurelia]|uniref:Cyclic nucleotide-binding domain-containing protein n=1 Tax=Paramecium pentaurelia TaxID=43138 RepID=A0A8S1T473_9CILI|nr:unnamed protein product [Paramecium pentaurelia]
MNSLNSVHIDNINTTGQQDTSMCKNPQVNQDCDSSSIILLKKIEAPSPDIPGFSQSVFKPFQKLIIYYHIGFFVKKLLKFIKPDQSFKPKHYTLIDDKSAGNIKDFINYAGKSKAQVMQYPSLEEVNFFVRMRYRYRQCLTNFKQKIFYLFEQIPLIDPSFKIKIIWDLLLNCFRIYLIYIIPIIITFEQLIENYDLIIIISQTVFAIDLLLRNITIYYDQGLPVIDRYQIVKNQYHITNLIELLEIFSLFGMAYFKFDFNSQFILFEGWPKFWMLLYFIQLKNLLNFIGSWQQQFIMGQLASSLIELSKLIGLLLIIQHIFSCIWLMIGRYNQISGITNWISAFNLDNVPWSELYIESMYFTSVTMYTVGYGDIHPINISEKVFAFLFVFVCTFQLSFSLNTIGEILTRMKNNNDIINKKLIFINQYMHTKKISHQLQFQVREYLNYYWYQEQTQQTKEQTDILSQLSDDLRMQIAVESNSIVLKNCEFFNKNFSNEFLNDLLKNLQFQSFQPSSTINIFNEVDYFIYIIESGQVDVYAKNQDKKVLIGNFKAGDHFGLNEFLTNQKTFQYEYKSSGFVSTLVIPKSKFYQLIQKYQVDFETYWNLKINNYTDIKCAICDSRRHPPDQCKQVHFIPDKEKVIKQYNYYQSQDRVMFSRNSRRIRQLYHAQTDQEILREAAQMVKVKNDSQFFQKYQYIQDDTTRFESQEILNKKDIESVGVLIKDLESKSYFDFCQKSQLKSEKEIGDGKLNLSSEFLTLKALKDKLNHKDLYTERELQQIEYQIQLLELKLNLEDKIELDKKHEYQTFNQKSNINIVLKKLINPVRYIMASTSKSLDQYTLISGNNWVKYLFYPYDFINQYRFNITRLGMPRKSLVVRQQEHRLSNALLRKKQQNRSIKRQIQVFPIK